MSAAPGPDDHAQVARPGEPANPGETTEVPAAAERERAAQALRAAFTRLAPQGSDAWNFLAAFTHLGDRYGPYQPGASTLSAAGRGSADSRSERRAGALGRLRFGPARHAESDADQTELEEAMGHVVEAFRFLSARVATLEERLAHQDRPVEGAAWLVPARELGEWVEPVARHVLDRSPGGTIVHADCGEGTLLRAMRERGADAHGVEPRGAVALRALEGGCAVTIAEAAEHLSSRASGSLGGMVLSGVIDRIPVHAAVTLLVECRRTLMLGAPIVVVSEAPRSAEQWGPTARDLSGARPLHRETWELLLERSGFVEIAFVAGARDADGRLALAAATPA